VPSAEPAPGPVEPTDVARVIGAGVPLLVGRIHVDLATGECSWSPEVEIMHGSRGGGRRTLAALRNSIHPDDQERVAGAVVDSARRGKPFAAAHRVVDKRGRTHTLVVIGGASKDPSSVEGAVVDVTPAQREALHREADGAVNRAMVARATVERATGALMALGGLDEETAARLLRETAIRAEVSASEAADQVMAYLVRDDTGTQGDVVHEALAAVTTVVRHDAAQLARRRTRR
jgi:hypothetical protein